MDVSKLPTDRLYKFKAVGGLVLLVSCLAFTAYSWHANNLEWYAIELRQGELEVDYDHWSSVMTEWKRAREIEEKLMVEIERRKNFGPTDPLTEEEKKVIRGNFKSLEKETNARLANPDDTIAMIDLMRSMYRDSPSIEEMQRMLDESERAIERFREQSKDTIDLGAKIDKLRKELGNSRAKLSYQQRVTWAYTVGCAVGLIFSFLLIKGGFRDWQNAENADTQPKD